MNTEKRKLTKVSTVFYSSKINLVCLAMSPCCQTASVFMTSWWWIYLTKGQWCRHRGFFLVLKTWIIDWTNSRFGIVCSAISLILCDVTLMMLTCQSKLGEEYYCVPINQLLSIIKILHGITMCLCVPNIKYTWCYNWSEVFFKSPPSYCLFKKVSTCCNLLSLL